MPRAATAAIITHMDRSVGRVLKLLEELNLDDDTIVFFTSDNGATPGPSDPEFFGACGPLRGTKGTLYEGGIRAPTIVRWPRRVPDGAVSRHVWYFADVLPTLAELAGTPAPAGIDGISIVPALLGERAAGREQAEHEYLYWEDGPDRAVRSGRWKAIRVASSPDRVALYDLESDVGENHDVASEHPDVVERLTEMLTSAHVDPQPQIEPPKPPGRQFQ
jgi:arylsulfatase A-like enzyme